MGLLNILFGHDVPKEKPVIKREPKSDVVEYFILKDKYQLISSGTDVFYFVDDKLTTHHLEKKYSNIYTWRASKIGDKIRTTKKFYPFQPNGNGYDGYYDNVLKYDIAEV